MDKYFGVQNSARERKERIKFHDFGNAHGHLELQSKMLEKEVLMDKGRRHRNNIRLNQLNKRRMST